MDRVHISLPDPIDAFDARMDDGSVIRVRRHGETAGPRVYLSHGNGFAIDAYYPYWRLLLARCDVILFDMRNHGRNPPAGFDGHNYSRMAHDIAEVVEASESRLGHSPKAGIFHSMSARAAMKQAVEAGWIWDALVLFDPPNVPPRQHPLYPAMRRFELRLVEFAANRQNLFSSPDELAAWYADARAHQGWSEGSHALMAKSVLSEDAGGQGWSLTCPPEYEASIYLAALTMDLWPSAGQFGGPVKLIGADPELDKGPPTGAANRALAAEGGYAYEAVRGTGHMLQLECPDECARATLDFLADCGLFR